MRRLALTLALLLLAGCAGAHSTLSGDPKYGKTAEDDYNAGQAELKSSNYAEAQRFFEHVRSKYPFSKFAALSELALADLRFEQGRYIESADAYQGFVKLHPTHESADYAAFRVGLSHFKEAPTDFVLFPPSYEKDQAEVRKAMEAFENFLRTRPGSKYAPEAQKLLLEARSRLAEHEWYVAEFYRKRGHWAGAANRLESLVKNYPGTRHEADALLQLAEAYLKLNERFRAQQALQQLIVKHPASPKRPEAEKLLASLR